MPKPGSAQRSFFPYLQKRSHIDHAFFSSNIPQLNQPTPYLEYACSTCRKTQICRRLVLVCIIWTTCMFRCFSTWRSFFDCSVSLVRLFEGMFESGSFSLFANQVPGSGGLAVGIKDEYGIFEGSDAVGQTINDPLVLKQYWFWCNGFVPCQSILVICFQHCTPGT